MSGRAIGALGEDRAVEYLQSIGYRIVERNKRYKLGEIDIVARDGDVFVLVEVKAGRIGIYGLAIARVGTQKQRKLRRLAARFSQEHPTAQLRIDVVNIDGEGEVLHIRNAVEAW